MQRPDIADQLRRVDARTVLIDGRSGSGKTTLATQLHSDWAGSVLVHLDDIYPGWDGLRAGSEHARRWLLEPRRAGRPGRWRRWDWATSEPAEWHTVDADARVIIEGAGALTTASRALADLGVWVECPAAVRKRRALLRDGAIFDGHWEQWAAQEDDHIARHRPQSLADVVVMDGAG
ncbi:hypothetical protein ACXDF8_06535 [Mycolicibacterium sp. CBM1]